jgi:hypothetical protein
MKLVERMAMVETEVKILKDSNSKEHGELKTMIKEFIDSAEKKFASKLTERIVYGLCAAILFSFITAITKLAGLW